MDIEIGNKKFAAIYNGTKIYVGRPSALGNPFAAKNSNVAAHRVSSDEDAVKLFRRHLWQKINEQDEAVMSALENILQTAKREKVVLLCWCVDRHGNGVCHAQTIKKAVEWLAEQKSAL